jgi:hypothetical protein
MAAGAAILAIGLLAASRPAVHQVEARDIPVSQANVELGDVADLSRVPQALRKRARRLVIAVFPRGRRRMALSERRIAERASAEVPALAPWLADGGDRLISVTLADDAPTAAPQAASCLELLHPLAFGAVAAQSDFQPAPCVQLSDGAPLRYDRATRVMRATRDLGKGERLAAPRGALAEVRPGQKLIVTARVGPVTVERDVVAVQPARSGDAVFVKANDGEIFSAPRLEVGR